MAYELKKDVEEVMEMDPEQFIHWLAFFKVTNEKRAKQAKGK